MWLKIKAWMGPVADAIKGTVNARELFRVVVAAIVAGGGLLGLLEGLRNAVPMIVPGAEIAWVTAGVVFAIELFRRFGHGKPLPKP